MQGGLLGQVTSYEGSTEPQIQSELPSVQHKTMPAPLSGMKVSFTPSHKDDSYFSFKLELWENLMHKSLSFPPYTTSNPPAM